MAANFSSTAESIPKAHNRTQLSTFNCSACGRVARPAYT